MSIVQYTIDSDVEIEPEIEEDIEEEPVIQTKKQKSKAPKKAFSIEFDTGELTFGMPSKLASSFSKKNKNTNQDSDDDDDEEEEEDKFAGKDDNIRAMPAVELRIARNKEKKINTNKKEHKSVAELLETEGNEENNGMNSEDEKDYFDVVVDTKKNKGNHEDANIQFSQLNLSRPYLRAIEAMGYTQPTPIQIQVIPYALAGRDICASAVTGSGKTAAFSLPFLERLLYRPKDVPATRVLIITPTRELATQIHEVLIKLTQYTDISSCLICGGKKDVKSQEATLRNQPDIIICTPGRMLDHLRNSRSITLDDLDVLVLDEVDRLLELGFQEEVEELVKHCPTARQTLLFSATMTPNVEDLIKLSLKKPIRIKTEASTSSLAPRLIQEFVKVRNPSEVEAMLLALVIRNFSSKTIVFFELKKSARRFCALLNVSGVKASELHGDLPQTQRYLSLENFRSGQVDILVATDVAARGLDIPGVQTVINAEMPRNVSIYVHRVGRTARAGCGGRSVTLVSDDRRKVMKDVCKGEANKENGSQILSRSIPAAILNHYVAKIASTEDALHDYLLEDRARMRVEVLEREAEKAQNLIDFADEIQSRPARTWFQSKAEKTALREKTIAVVKEEKKKAAAKEFDELNADEKQKFLALQDDYRLDEKEDKKKLAHRLSRKKRRRQEALKEVAQEMEASEERGETPMKFNPKIAKNNVRQKEKDRTEKSAGEIAMKKVVISDDFGLEGEGAPAKKKVKIVRQKFAVGGLDLDQAEWASEGSAGRKMSKTEIRKAAEELSFKEFDPEKRLRKGGKAGHASFKSKKRFKRR